MTERPRDGYPQREPYRPENDPRAQHGWRPYGGQPGQPSYDDRYRDQPRDEYEERHDRYPNEPERRGGGAKWVVIILAVIGALVLLFWWLNRDDANEATPADSATPSQTTEEQTTEQITQDSSPAEETTEAEEQTTEEQAGEAIGDAVLPQKVENWTLNTFIVPTYMSGSDAVTVVEGDSAPDDMLAQLNSAMSDPQTVEYGQCGTFEFERVDNAGFLEDLGASPQACTLHVGDTPLLLVNLKGADVADLVTIAEAVQQR